MGENSTCAVVHTIMSWEIFQFAFAKKNGGVRFIAVGLDLEEDDLEAFEKRLENLGQRLSLLARFSNCESAQSHNTMVEFISVHEFRGLLKSSRTSEPVVEVLPALVPVREVSEFDRELFSNTLCSLGFRRHEVRRYVETMAPEEWDGPAEPRVRSAIQALSA